MMFSVGTVENVNAQVDALIHTGILRRLLAFTELKFSNSMIEAWWRSLKHQWLFLHPLDTTSPPSVDWSRSTLTNTTACFPIRRFTDRRPMRCTSAPGKRYRPTCGHARLQPAGLALRPTDWRRARHARVSRTRRRDRGMLTAVPTTEPDFHGPVRPAVKPGGNGEPHVGRQNRARDQSRCPLQPLPPEWRELARESAECL